MKNKNVFFIVGIGASAGGVEAIVDLVKEIPEDSNMAYIIIQHLSSDQENVMDIILKKVTDLDIKIIKDNMEIIPNTIYIMPASKNIILKNKKLKLIEKEKVNKINSPINIFFKSLADELEEKAIGIVLSGSGRDGSKGIISIKEKNGLVIAQDESSSQYPSMPKSAKDTGVVDFVLKPVEMIPKLIKHLENPIIYNSDLLKQNIFNDYEAFRKINSILFEELDVDFSYNKKTSFNRRIQKRMELNEVDSLEEYIKILCSSKDEIYNLYKDLLIGVTEFFRNPKNFSQLEKKVFPKIFQNKSENEVIRIWVAGCSTGEEAYSIAILINEYIEKNDLDIDVKIFATDINKKSLEIARVGKYKREIEKKIPQNLLKKYFEKRNNDYYVKEEIRSMIIYSYHNLINDPPFSNMDLISCRNLLIYLQPILQKNIISLFHFALKEKGFLFLGSSETVGKLSKYFSVDNVKWKIFQIKNGNGSPLKKEFEISENFKFPFYKKINRKNVCPVTIDDSKDKINTDIIQKISDLTLIIDNNYKIIHFIGDLNLFFKLPESTLDMNILKMISKDLSITFGIAINKVYENKEPFSYKKVSHQIGKSTKIFDIEFLPFNINDENLILLIINKSDNKDDYTELNNIEFDKEINNRIKYLENELELTRNKLQLAIEDLETSNEELQSKNEELLLSNEELQSTNEELQSVNENLYSSNSEHRNKIESLKLMSKDIDYILEESDIGVIFLDNEYKIKKFNSKAFEIINIIKVDIGRSIFDISYKLDYENFFDDIIKVNEKKKSISKKIKSKNDNIYNIKIFPHKTNGKFKGIIIISNKEN